MEQIRRSAHDATAEAAAAREEKEALAQRLRAAAAEADVLHSQLDEARRYKAIAEVRKLHSIMVSGWYLALNYDAHAQHWV
jgi:O-phosphoseryl-tRNA(Cys) synthetase